jgi:hypothetical protein
MLSVAYHEPPTEPTAPPERSIAPLRRIAVTFPALPRETPRPRQTKRAAAPAVAVPRYSRIIFRAGAVLAR